MSSPPKKTGGDLQSIRLPQKVKVLILSQNKTTIKDFYLIKNFTKLIKLDLSYNKISSFPQGFAFKQFNQLRTLFLHYNKFTTIKNVLPVIECQSLQYFTLFGNQLEEAKARHFLVNEMPNLMLMDDKTIRLQERNCNFNLKEVQTSRLYFPLIPHKEEESSKMYIEILVKELVIVRREFLNANPIIKIQRWWRILRKTRHKEQVVEKVQEQRPIQRQSSLKDYKQDLDRLATQKMQVSRSNQEIIGSLLYQQYQFWGLINKIVKESKVYLSREFCQLRGIHFEELPHLQFIRNNEHISLKELRKRRNLLFFQFLHQQNIIKKCNPNRKGKSMKEVSHKMYELYKINRNRFIQHQERLIKKEADYSYYVMPLASKEDLVNIVKIEYRKALLSDSKFCQIPFLIQSFSLRSMAAVSIQRHWKGYKVRKSVNAYLRIKEKESAIKIQRWLRNLKFIHRHKFLLEVSHYLKKERNSEIITLEITQIEAIQSYCTYIENAANNLRILFQENQFQVAKNAERSTQRIIFHAERKPYPSYINLTFPAINQTIPSSTQLPKKQKRSSILQILFKEVKDISKITDSKGVKYIKFTYESIQQALNRKFILSLKTYRMINHQFIRSKQAPNVPSQYSCSLISQVNNNRLVTMMFDSQKKRAQGSIEHLATQLSNSKSQSSLNSDITLISDVLCIKIKYFIVKTDLSCTLFIKQPNYALQLRKFQTKQPLKLNANQFYFGKRSLSKRYDDSGEVLSKISRNIMSLNDCEGTSSQPSQRKIQERRESAVYPKILNTDQSHSIIDFLSPKNSMDKFLSYRKMESYDRFDKEVYPAVTESIKDSLRYLESNQDLKSKREKIEEIKSSHKQNIAYISVQKTENLSNLRRSIVKENEEAIKKIDEARSMLEKEKLRKHDRIKEHFKSSSGNFQQQFLKKGIKSIKKELKEYEKHRSFRESTQNMPNHPSQPKINSLKTEMREFSINFSDADLLHNNQQNIDNKSKQPHIRQLLKKTIENYDSRNQSCQSEKSQEQLELEKQQYQVQNKNKQKDKQRKKLRKKRLVHSVFPQQFYPIRQSNQIGFQLPKIAKK